MPYKDPAVRKARQKTYSRNHYERNRKQIIAATSERKHGQYAGVCVNCGGPTVGNSKNDVPRFCSKPGCASVQRKPTDG